MIKMAASFPNQIIIKTMAAIERIRRSSSKGDSKHKGGGDRFFGGGHFLKYSIFSNDGSGYETRLNLTNFNS